jgi:hypothetical protein
MINHRYDRMYLLARANGDGHFMTDAPVATTRTRRSPSPRWPSRSRARWLPRTAGGGVRTERLQENSICSTCRTAGQRLQSNPCLHMAHRAWRLCVTASCAERWLPNRRRYDPTLDVAGETYQARLAIGRRSPASCTLCGEPRMQYTKRRRHDSTARVPWSHSDTA